MRMLVVVEAVVEKEADYRPRGRDRQSRLQQELEEAQQEEAEGLMEEARPRGRFRRRGVQEALAVLMRMPGTATSCQLRAARRQPPEEPGEAGPGRQEEVALEAEEAQLEAEEVALEVGELEEVEEARPGRRLRLMRQPGRIALPLRSTTQRRRRTRRWSGTRPSRLARRVLRWPSCECTSRSASGSWATSTRRPAASQARLLPAPRCRRRRPRPQEPLGQPKPRLTLITSGGVFWGMPAHPRERLLLEPRRRSEGRSVGRSTRCRRRRRLRRRWRRRPSRRSRRRRAGRRGAGRGSSR